MIPLEPFSRFKKEVIALEDTCDYPQLIRSLRETGLMIAPEYGIGDIMIATHVMEAVRTAPDLKAVRRMLGLDKTDSDSRGPVDAYSGQPKQFTE